MQPEVSTPRSRARRAGEREPSSYGYEYTGGIGQTILFYLQQPTVIGTLIVTIIGTLVGVRLAQMQAMRRRRTFINRMMELLGSVGIIAMTMMRMRRRAMFMQRMMRGRGQDITETTRDLGSTIMDNVSMMGSRRMRARPGRNMARQIGSAASLIPVAFALMRNPLIRDIGFRIMARRTTQRMGFGIARRFMGR